MAAGPPARSTVRAVVDGFLGGDPIRVCKRILSGLLLLLTAAVLLLSLAGGVGVWVVRGRVAAKAAWVFERVDSTLDVAEQGLGQVKTSLARAAERLDKAREEQRELARQPQRPAAARRFLARTVQQQVAPELDNAHEKLHTVAEAAAVVNSVLEDVGNFPLLSAAGLELDRLAEINGSLSRVESSAWELVRLLGEPEAEAGSDAGVRLSQVDRTLKTVRGLVAEYEPQLAQVRQRAEGLRSKTLSWITPAAIILSLSCLWVALSQVSLLAHAWSWWKRSGGNPTATPP
jgi:hypothetical protein